MPQFTAPVTPYGAALAEIQHTYARVHHGAHLRGGLFDAWS